MATWCFFLLEGYPSLIFDSRGYYDLSETLRTRGLLPWPIDFRTYGYPLFLALVTGFRGLPPEELRVLVSCVQLAAYLGACAYVARKLAKIFQSESTGVLAYTIGALNPMLLLHATEPLTDLLSAVLIQLAVALSWKLPIGPEDSRPMLRQPFLAFLCAGSATAVRPANAVIVAALALVWAIRVVRWRERFFPIVGAALAGLIPPLIPQMVINYSLVQKLNPLLVGTLYRDQRLWGMRVLKYGTLVMPGHSPHLNYSNPLFQGDPGPRAFLLHHPLGYLTTLALHAFGIVDFDLPFTYITDLHPWYRWPLSVVNYLFLYVALVGCVLAAIRVIRRRPVDPPGFALLSTIVVGAAYLLLYLPVAVENRFGIALEALATPLVVVAILWFWRGDSSHRATARRLLILGAPIYVVGCVVLSAWISTKQTNPLIASPANAYVIDPPRAYLSRTPTIPPRP